MCKTSHWTFLQQAWVSTAAPGPLLDNSPPLYLSWKKLGISKNPVSLLVTRSGPGHWDTESVGITANCQTRVTSPARHFIKKIFIHNSLQTVYRTQLVLKNQLNEMFFNTYSLCTLACKKPEQKKIKIIGIGMTDLLNNSVNWVFASGQLWFILQFSVSL